jgi:hypothetical protein
VDHGEEPDRMQALTTMLPRPSWGVVSLVAAMLLLLTTCGGATQDRSSSVGMQPMAADTTPGVSSPTSTEQESVLPDAGQPAESGDIVADGPEPEGTDAPGEQPSEESDSRQVVAPEPLPEEVELFEPDLIVRSPDGLGASHDLDGADHAAGVRELTAATDDGEGASHDLELMAVDPTSFRPLTPEVTAQSPAVWERLDDGDVLVRHDVAHELELELGETMVLESEHGSTEVRIGALAANGAPPFADVIVPFEVASMLGSPGLNALIVSAEDEPETLADTLEDLGKVEVRRPPEPERTTSQPTSGPVELEPFTYTSRGDGTIAIHGDWAQRNIVPVDIPGMGTTQCHKAMVPQLYAALQEIIDEGLYGHFKPEQFGGCWVPRHILWNPDRSLSMHAWGLAIDFNVQDNWFGETPQMDPRIVKIFEKWGFEWGGHWSTPDGMHFELDRFVEVP